MTPALHVVSAGKGNPIVLVHGSATTHATWTIQLQSPLTERYRLVAYDRRGSGPELGPVVTVPAHADDLHALLLACQTARPGAPLPLVVGSSFGAVVVLDVMRRFGGAMAGAVLIEPPMAASDAAPAIPTQFLAEFDRLVASEGGPQAGEYFLRTVLTDAGFEKMPKLFAERSKALYAAIRRDSEALGQYRPRYQQLRDVAVPTLLLGGGTSPSYFGATLDALAAVLPKARRHVVPGVGHMLHAQAPRAFAALVTAFYDEVACIA